MDEIELPDEMRDAMRASWHRYLDQVQPLRPQLYAYCRRLTRNAWDADDLVQESLMKAFGLLGHVHDPIRNPRAYLLRTATHLWIDAIRRREREGALEPAEPANPGPSPDQAAEVRSAGAALIQRLPPQECAAVLLKEVFDMSLEETAEVLGTTRGAVKAALHRGRGRLGEEQTSTPSTRPEPSRALLERFVDRLQARDKEGLLELVHEHATAANVGCGYQFGEAMNRGPHSWFDGATSDHPEWPEWLRWDSTRVELARFEGEPVVLVFHGRDGVEFLEIVNRIEERDGKIAAVRSYGFCPELMREVGETLGHRVNTGLYRYPTPAPGEFFAD